MFTWRTVPMRVILKNIKVKTGGLQSMAWHPAERLKSSTAERHMSSMAGRQRSGPMLAFVAGAIAAAAVGITTACAHGLTSTTTQEVGQKQPFGQSYKKAEKELKALLGDRFSVHPADLEERSTEATGRHPIEWPQAVVWPQSTEEVSKIMKICHKYGIPVVPYAAGTSLEGNTTAPKGGLAVDVRQMDKVLTLNEKDMDVVVQPGVGWMELNSYLKPHGFFLGVDPAPGACIGGMCGTCCSGTNAVRYGTMKDQVVNLTVVLADGTVVKTGQRARKSSAGYDLARLFVGSEGTLGIVTEATLKVRSIPERIVVARISFQTVQKAADAVVEMLQKGIQLGAAELLDEVMVEAMNRFMDMDLEESPCLLLKFTGSQSSVANDIEAAKTITSKYTTSPYVYSKTDEESEQLWQARKDSFWATQSAQPTKKQITTDVAVPLSRLAECIAETKKDLVASPLYCPIIGHVGDSNFHVDIFFDPNDEHEVLEASRLNDLMVYRAISMDGTCTGEHGIGIGKKQFLKAELGEGALKTMKAIKKALDPKNIMNPGKVLDI